MSCGTCTTNITLPTGAQGLAGTNGTDGADGMVNAFYDDDQTLTEYTNDVETQVPGQTFTFTSSGTYQVHASATVRVEGSLSCEFYLRLYRNGVLVREINPQVDMTGATQDRRQMSFFWRGTADNTNDLDFRFEKVNNGNKVFTTDASLLINKES